MQFPPPIDTQKEIQQITAFIARTLKTAGKTHAVVAISGGIDSATSLLLAAKALDPENVFPLHLPSKHSNPLHTTDAREAMNAANIPEANRTTVNIGAILQKTWRIIHHYAPSSPIAMSNTANRKQINAKVTKINRLRLANLAARVRMMVIYDHAKKLDGLVVGTENYSEHLLGYFTRFGDEASDLEPIKHLYKTQVIELAKTLGVPQSIITKAPSADLWLGQTDANELGFTYEQADPILYLYHQGKSANEIGQLGYEKSLVTTVLNQVKISAFKHHVPYSIPKSENS